MGPSSKNYWLVATGGVPPSFSTNMPSSYSKVHLNLKFPEISWNFTFKSALRYEGDTFVGEDGGTRPVATNQEFFEGPIKIEIEPFKRSLPLNTVVQWTLNFVPSYAISKFLFFHLTNTYRDFRN